MEVSFSFSKNEYEEAIGRAGTEILINACSSARPLDYVSDILTPGNPASTYLAPTVAERLKSPSVSAWFKELKVVTADFKTEGGSREDSGQLETGILGRDLSVWGSLWHEEKLIVDCHVTGAVIAPVLTVGENAEIAGGILASTLKGFGTTTARTCITRRLELKSTAEFEGPIAGLPGALSIEEGAFLLQQWREQSIQQMDGHWFSAPTLRSFFDKAEPLDVRENIAPKDARNYVTSTILERCSPTVLYCLME